MLKDDYETLLRRGMPEHPNLRRCGDMLVHRAFDDDEFGRSGATALCDSETRDLLAMHALRWLYGMKDARLREKYIDDWSTRLGSGQHRCAPDDTIAAVLCATRDLEPKDPLDTFIERHAC